MAEQSGAQYEQSLRLGNDYSREMMKTFQKLDGISEATRKKMVAIADATKGTADVGDKLNKLIQERQAFIDEEVSKGRAISQNALKHLDTEIELLEKAKNIKDIQKEFGDNLASSLGISSELVDAFKAGSAAALGFFVMKQVLGFITDSVGKIKEFRNEFGTTYDQAASLNGELLKSRFSLEGMILGSDKLESAMKSIVSETGNFKLATSDLITDVGVLSEMVGDQSAVGLARSLKNAGHSTQDLVEHARDLSKELGISGSEGMKYLAENQLELTGLSEDQLKLKIREGMELKKMGADMEHLNSLASEALDIESSLRNEMKLRAMTGKDISFNELRAAQASGDRAAIAAAEKKLIDELGPSLEGNLQVQRMISDATGLSKEQMLNYKNATIEATAESDKNSDSVEGTTKMAGLLSQTWVQIGGGILLAVGAIALLGAAMKKLGAGKGAGNAMRGLSKGFAAFASPQAALGLGVVTLAIIGLGAAMRLATPAFEAIGKAIATIVTSIGEFIIGFAEIASPEKVLAMLGLAASFGAVAAALLAFSSAGILAMPAMAAVGMFTATMSALGMSGGGESSGDSALISEIKGLRSDIQSQPILINVDGRVVSQITKVQNRKNSTRTSGYGG
jgi:hypothetical protein